MQSRYDMSAEQYEAAELDGEFDFALIAVKSPFHRAALEPLAAGRNVDAFVSHRLTLDDVNKGFDLMHHQDGIRSVIQYA